MSHFGSRSMSVVLNEFMIQSNALMLIGSETYPIMISNLVFYAESVSRALQFYSKRLDALKYLANKKIFAQITHYS